VTAALPRPGLLFLDRAERTYGGAPPVRALRPATLAIFAGDYVSLMGRSGSGKSTLLNLMGLLDRPTAGSVAFTGTDTRNIPDRQMSALRANHIGFVFQTFNLIPHRTAAENVALGLAYQRVPRSERIPLALQALDRVGMLHRAGAQPGQLSGGERQRLAIARALAGRPALLLCDEPTGNLDTTSARAVLDLLDSLNGDRIAVVIVTHDPGVAARTHRHLAIADGVITEEQPARPGAERRKPDGERIVPAWNKVTARGGTLASGLGDIITEASTSVSARPVRSSLTMLGAAIGVAAFAVVTGLTSTTRAQVNGRFTSLAATEVVVSDTHPGPRSLAFPPDTEQLIGRIHGVLSSGVTFQVPVPSATSITRLPSAVAPGSANSVQVAAASPGVFPTVQATLAVGRAYSRIADQRRQHVVVLGQGAAEQLGVRDISAQPAVYIDGIPFTVTGILKSVRREASLLQDAIIPEQTALAHWGPPSDGADLIVATRPGSAAVVASQIPAAILPTDPGRLVVVTSSAPFILQAVINSDISRLLLLAGIIALLIGAAAIASITLTSVLERFYEIGVRRALGATRPAIVAQFLTEATILSTCGGLAGTCIAVMTLVAVSGANGWYPVLNPLTIIPDPLIGAAVGCVAGAYPALRAALLDPVEALRR